MTAARSTGPDKLAKLVGDVRERADRRSQRRSASSTRPPAIPSRTNVFTVPPRVLIDNQASRSHTVIEVNGRDRPGLLYELTRELTRLNLQVSSAKISTYGEKVVDVFYVKNLFGHKVEHPDKLTETRAALTEVLAKGNRPQASSRLACLAAPAPKPRPIEAAPAKRTMCVCRRRPVSAIVRRAAPY